MLWTSWTAALIYLEGVSVASLKENTSAWGLGSRWIIISEVHLAAMWINKYGAIFSSVMPSWWVAVNLK